MRRDGRYRGGMVAGNVKEIVGWQRNGNEREKRGRISGDTSMQLCQCWARCMTNTYIICKHTCFQ